LFYDSSANSTYENDDKQEPKTNNKQDICIYIYINNKQATQAMYTAHSQVCPVVWLVLLVVGRWSLVFVRVRVGVGVCVGSICCLFVFYPKKER
jgi:hypothetical protein